jgi:hypothetical protein
MSQEMLAHALIHLPLAFPKTARRHWLVERLFTMSMLVLLTIHANYQQALRNRERAFPNGIISEILSEPPLTSPL